jgi:O-antigen ligase
VNLAATPSTALICVALAWSTAIAVSWHYLSRLPLLLWIAVSIISIFGVVQHYAVKSHFNLSMGASANLLLVLLYSSVLPFGVACRNSKARNIILFAVSSVGIVAALSCAMEFVQGQIGAGDGVVTTAADSTGVYKSTRRLSGFYETSILSATTMIMCWPFCGVMVRRYLSTGSPAVYVTCSLAALQISAILLTYTRAAYIGLTLQASLVLYWTLKHKANWRPISYAVAFVCVLAVVLLFVAGARESLVRRFASLLNPVEGSVSNRLVVIRAALEMWAERPWTGWGIGTFREQYWFQHRMPGVTYKFYDAHSGVVLSLFEFGLIGLGIWITALVGLRGLATLRRCPKPVLLSLVGVLPCTMSDHPILNHPGIAIIYCIVLAQVLRCNLVYSHKDVGRLSIDLLKHNSFGLPSGAKYTWKMIVVVAVMVIWSFEICRRPVEPVIRLKRQLERCAQSLRGDVAFRAFDEQSKTYLESNNGGMEYGSALAGVAVIAGALDATERRFGLPDFRLVPGGEVQFLDVSSTDFATWVLTSPSKSKLSAAIGNLSDVELTSASYFLLGHSGFRLGEIRDACTACSAYEVRSNRKIADSELLEFATSATLRSLESTYRKLIQSRVSTNAAHSDRLNFADDKLGFSRHLQSIEEYQGTSVFTGSMREEVLFVRRGFFGWSVSGFYFADKGVTPRPDNAANRMFAEAAWRVHCYLEGFPHGFTAMPNRDDRHYYPWLVSRP